MAKILFIIITFSPLYLKSQNLEKLNNEIEEKWSGTIVLNNNQELDCDFIYNPLMSGGLLIVKTDSMTNVYPPEKIQSFRFYDDGIKSKRQFYSLPFNPGDIKKHFFELIYESDRISVLGSNTIINKNAGKVNQSDFSRLSSDISLLRYGKRSVTKTKVKSDYKKYLLDHQDGVIYNFSRKQFLEMIEDNLETINYMYKKHYHLNEKDLYQYIELIDLYSKTGKSH